MIIDHWAVLIFSAVVYLNYAKVEKHSDHNAILLKLNLITTIEKQKKNRISTKCGYRKYRNKLTQAENWNIKEGRNSSKL